MRIWVFIYTVILSVSVQAQEFNSFYQAKKHLIKTLPPDQTTLYCQCNIIKMGKKLVPDTSSCGYTPRRSLTHAGKINSRALRIEWEHIMPAWEFGHQLKCWQQGGRKHCRKNSALFRKMEADINNLAPAIGEINGDRSNYRFGHLTNTIGQYGTCPVKINFKQRVIEPPNAARKQIAKAYFYMRDTYHIRLSKKQTQLFNAWLTETAL